MPPTTSGLETEWDYSGRKRGGINKRRKYVKRMRKGKKRATKDEAVNGQGEKGKGVCRAHVGQTLLVGVECSLAQ